MPTSSAEQVPSDGREGRGGRQQWRPGRGGRMGSEAADANDASASNVVFCFLCFFPGPLDLRIDVESKEETICTNFYLSLQ